LEGFWLVNAILCLGSHGMSVEGGGGGGINVVVVEVCIVGGGDGICTIGGVVGREGSEGGMEVVDIST